MGSIIVERLARDRPAFHSDEVFSFGEVLRSLTSPHVIMVFVIFFCNGTTLYGLALFLPSIVNQLGFSATRSQLISVGPYAAGFFGTKCKVYAMHYDNSCLSSAVTLASAFFSDRYRARAVPTMIVAILAVAGFSLYLGEPCFCFQGPVK